MRTLFTNYLRLRFAHRIPSSRSTFAGSTCATVITHSYVCDIQLSPTWTYLSSFPRDLPKPLGAHSLPAFRQALRNAFSTLWRPKHQLEHGVTMQGTPIPWGVGPPRQPQDAQALCHAPSTRFFGSCSVLGCVWSYVSSLSCPLMLPPAKLCHRKGPCLPRRHLQQDTDSRGGAYCPCHREKPSEEAKQDMNTLQSPTCCP